MGGGLGGILNKKVCSDEKAAADGVALCHQEAEQRAQNPYLNQPVNPEEAHKIFLVQARAAARRVAGGNLQAKELRRRGRTKNYDVQRKR